MASDIPSDEELTYFAKVIGNARRLASDAELLCESNRAASAMMIGILALEELGKALIAAWGVKNRANRRTHPTHVEKQAATFALLSAQEITDMPKSKLRHALESGTLNFNTLGPMSLQFSHARSGFFENVRMSVTYADKMPILPLESVEGGIHVALAREFLGWFDQALKAMNNTACMNLASEFFENDLGRM